MGKYDGYHTHQFDKDVQGRTGCVFERVTNGVAKDGSLVAVRTLATEVAFFDILLGIVPSTTGVGHEDSQYETATLTANEQTENTSNAEDDTRQNVIINNVSSI